MAEKEATLLLRIKESGTESLKSIRDSMEDIQKVGAAAFGLLAAVVWKSIDAWREQEQATNALTQSLVNNGVYSKELRDSYLEQASALQKVTTFGDEAIVQAQASLQQQIGQTKITKELTMSILDFATAQKMDLKSAADLVGKSIGTGTNALTRYGIEVSTSASQSDKLAQVMAGLNSKFGGQAEQAAQGLGAIQQFKNAWGDVFEVIGERLAPAITLISKLFTGLATDSDNLAFAAEAVAQAFKVIVTATAYIIHGFDSLTQVLASTLITISQATSAALEGEFSLAKKYVVAGIDDLTKTMQDKNTAFEDRLAAIDQAFEAKKEENRAIEEQNLINSLNRKSEIKTQKAIEDQTRELERTQADRDLKLALEEAQHQEDLASLEVKNQEKSLAMSKAREMELKAQIDFSNKQISQASTQAQKLKLMQDKANLESQLADQKHNTNQIEFEKKKNEIMEANRASSLSRIAALANSNNHHLAAMGKAAALTQIAIDGPQAIVKALASAPPPFNFVLAGGVAAAIGAQTAQVLGVPLAEGGIVKARPGGIQATIGEGGSDEAVIPLDKAGNIFGAPSINITVYGGLLGDRSSAHEFALAIDQELLNLRRNNESQAFDARVI